VGAKVRDGARGRASGIRDEECGCGHAHAATAPWPLVLPEDLRGRRAVVTGAARGIGEAIAKWLIMARADVTVVDKDEDTLKRVFRTERCQTLFGDLGQEKDVTDLADELTRHEPVELIVNNVGITTRQRFQQIGRSEFNRVLSTNLEGPWFFTSRLVDAFIEQQQPKTDRRPRQRGSILFISSLHDHVVARQPHYSMSKASVAQLTRELAVELAEHQIRVNAISPGWIRTAEDTSTTEQIDKEAHLGRRIPLGMAGVPADVARVAVFLLSDAWSGYLTGQNIAVDGGLSLHSFLDE
jgi:NAD(P)-dependent dehydrogenase (short-subunit alcohol dehydrogenase family)